jgi:hypothetical protein
VLFIEDDQYLAETKEPRNTNITLGFLGQSTKQNEKNQYIKWAKRR